MNKTYSVMNREVCNGCTHSRFGEVRALNLKSHFSGWKCIRKRVMFGDNKEAGQIQFPKKCKEKVAI